MSSPVRKWKLAKYFFYGLLISLILCTNACHNKKTAKKSENYTIITAEAKPIITSLHYSGTLAPLSSKLILSPTAGDYQSILHLRPTN